MCSFIYHDANFFLCLNIVIDGRQRSCYNNLIDLSDTFLSASWSSILYFDVKLSCLELQNVKRRPIHTKPELMHSTVQEDSFRSILFWTFGRHPYCSPHPGLQWASKTETVTVALSRRSHMSGKGHLTTIIVILLSDPTPELQPHKTICRL